LRHPLALQALLDSITPAFNRAASPNHCESAVKLSSTGKLSPNCEAGPIALPIRADNCAKWIAVAASFATVFDQWTDRQDVHAALRTRIGARDRLHRRLRFDGAAGG
jgi:hypothetical protein